MSPMPAISTTRLRLFAALPVISAAVISFESVRHLAETAHFGWLAWLFPLTLDAAVAFGTDLWIRTVPSPAMRQARALALTMMAMSLIANAVDHWISTGSVLAAFLGAVPPAILAAMVSILHRHAVPRVPPGTVPAIEPEHVAVPGPIVDVVPREDRITVPLPLVRSLAVLPWSALQDQPVRPPVPADRLVPFAVKAQRKRTAATRIHVAGTRSTGGASDQEIVRWVQDQGGATKASIMEKFSVGSGRALRLKREAKEA